MEKHRYELLTDRMSIFVFELGKLPKEINANNILELFLRVFKADTEEELEALENLEVNEMTQMVNAYRDIVNSPDYADLERRRLMNAMDENQALNQARREGKAQSDAEWQSVVSEKDAKWQTVVADKDAEIARLLAKLGVNA